MSITFLVKRTVQFVVCLFVILLTYKSDAAIVTDYKLFEYERFSDEIVSERIANLSGTFDMRYTSEARRKIYNYVVNYRKDSELLLARAGMYFHIIEKELRDKNLPEELKYLVIIESALNPTAQSKAGAVGLWQFMPGTAEVYGLKIDRIVDERRDPNLATSAALDYLADLEAQFGSWTLAVAAYNCGPGNMRKAIRKANSKNFWKLQPFLPKETQDYVPRLIAATYLMKYYHAHDLQPANLSEELAITNATQVTESLKFNELCELLDLNLKTVETLNPAFLQKVIPANNGRYLLRLPESKMYDFLINKDEILGYFNLDNNGRIENYDQLKAAILVNSKTEVKVIASPVVKKNSYYDTHNIFNDLDEDLESDNIREDDEQLPTPPQAFELKSIDSGIGRNRKTRFEYYKISKGETIDDIISRRSDLSKDEIININNLNPDFEPTSGAIIKVKQLD